GSSPPFSYVPRDLGDPKEMETPRPPRRAFQSAPPPPNLPQPPAPPREFVGSSPPSPRRGTDATGISTVPPGPLRSRGSSPPQRLFAGSPPPPAIAPGESAAPESRSKRGTLPPGYST